MDTHRSGHSDVIDRIIQVQSPDVDAVTGANGSSKCIMLAVQKALQKQ
ncbi:MAG: FMN-binding protein [candidate division WOR-3 bacterium]|nr:MAG: FMN-binding protein [candidate division WOR-3 bacterium]